MTQIQPPEKDEDEATIMANAMMWVSVVSTVVGVMLVPTLGGIWIDNLLGTQYLFIILGAIIGLVGGMYCLLSILR